MPLNTETEPNQKNKLNISDTRKTPKRIADSQNTGEKNGIFKTPERHPKRKMESLRHPKDTQKL